MMTGESEQPLVSVVLLVYNAERHLRECLDSILAQTYPNCEVLVMDDASTDATWEILASYRERVACYRQPQNRGIYGNANDGIASARGEFIAIYHGDDVYHSQIVEREAAYLQRYSEAGAVFSKDVFIDDDGNVFGRLELPAEVRRPQPLDYRIVLNAQLTHRNSFLRCPTSMVRASVYRAVGPYIEGDNIIGDQEMWLRIASRFQIGILDEHLLRYRCSAGSVSQQHRRRRMAPDPSFAVVDQYLADGGRALATARALAAHEAHRAEDLTLLAVNLYVLGRQDEARAILSRVRLSRLIASPMIQRGRLAVLYLALCVLTRLPRVPVVARAFAWRWQERQIVRQAGRFALEGGW